MASAPERLIHGRYRVGPLLGAGAVGEVSRATDELLGRDVAIKMLRPANAQDELVVQRFYAEARAAAGLVDQHIVAVYDVLADEELHAIVMEFVDGPSLAQILKQNGRVPETRAISYARQTAHALGVAHDHGILHRDIKPANILLARDLVKVADFGLAKAIANDDLAMTEPGKIVGSAFYFSPEQAQGLPLTPASDLYSLGVVLHQLTTGTLPFEGTTAIAMALAHVNEPVPSIAALSRTMTPGLAAIVHRLLCKDPEGRYARAAELDAALAQLERPHSELGAHWDAPTMVGVAPVPPTRAVPPADDPGYEKFVAALAAFGAFVSTARTRVSGAAQPALARARPRLRTAWESLRADVAELFGSSRGFATTAGSKPAGEGFNARGEPGAAGNQAPPTLDAQRRMRYIAIALGGIVITLVAIVLARRDAITVTDVRHAQVADARSKLTAAGLTPKIVTTSAPVSAGTVLDQTPKAGTVLHRDSPVRLTVSSGPEMVTIPKVLGLEFRAAARVMQKLKLKTRYAGKITDAPVNVVIEQFPAAGMQVRPGTPALVVISIGPNPQIRYTR